MRALALDEGELQRRGRVVDFENDKILVSLAWFVVINRAYNVRVYMRPAKPRAKSDTMNNSCDV